MIKNQRQFEQARRQLARWNALKSRLSKLSLAFSIDETALIDTAEQKIACLQQNLDVYQDLRRNRFAEQDILKAASKLPTSLIKARIALGWSQSELARRAGLQYQHIYRYEKNVYSAVNLCRAIKIAGVLQEALTEHESALKELESLLPIT